jgi:hypothetical protein
MPRLLLFVFNYTSLLSNTERTVAAKGDVSLLAHQHNLEPNPSGSSGVSEPTPALGLCTDLR